MPPRPVPVFCYGLSMDPARLAAQGLPARNLRGAPVDDYTLRIDVAARMEPEAGARVYGTVMDLIRAEQQALYATLPAYEPDPMLARLLGGDAVTAVLAFNLPVPPEIGGLARGGQCVRGEAERRPGGTGISAVIHRGLRRAALMPGGSGAA